MKKPKINALWLNRLYSYKNLPIVFETAKTIINLKIERQTALLIRYKKYPYKNNILEARNKKDIFLIEARAAKHFWQQFSSLLPKYIFSGRQGR